MRKIIVIVTFAVFGLCKLTAAGAQSLLDSAKNEITRVNQVFDSSALTGFTADILYYTDTAYGYFERQEKRVNYCMNKANYYFKTDDMLYMQNDSFTVNIDLQENNMLVAKTIRSDLSNQFALKEFIDMSLTLYDSLFNIEISTPDSNLQKISFTAKPGISDSLLPGYRYFSITYDNVLYYPGEMELTLTERKVAPINVAEAYISQKMKITFTDFRPLTSSILFDEHQYFYFDGALKEFMPTEQYKYFRLIAAGFDSEEDDSGNTSKPPVLVEGGED